MTMSLGAEIEPGIIWEVQSDATYCSGPTINVPVDCLSKWDDETIGRIVRSLEPLAWKSRALSFADNLNYQPGNRLYVPEHIIKEHAADIALLRQFAGIDVVDRALEKIDYMLNRMARRKRSPEQRKDMRQNYNRKFVALGRRDGFICTHCGKTTPELQIDHVVPLIEGGSNDLNNLQLLCPNCNRSKWDKLPGDENNGSGTISQQVDSRR